MNIRFSAHVCGMFCCFILLLSSGLPVAAAPDDPVDIPDPVLRTHIETALKKSAGDTITEADMAQLTDLRPGRTGDVRELTGLEHAINLTGLQLIRPQIRTQADLNASPRWNPEDLEPLRGLTALEYLNLGEVIIFDMAPLADLTNLKFLTLNQDLRKIHFYGRRFKFLT